MFHVSQPLCRIVFACPKDALKTAANRKRHVFRSIHRTAPFTPFFFLAESAISFGFASKKLRKKSNAIVYGNRVQNMWKTR